MKKYLLYIIFFTIAYSLVAQKQKMEYSFFSAGHTYGSPLAYHYGLHYPFVDYITLLNNNQNMKLGFLTGDVVFYSMPDYWDSAQIDINKFQFPIYIAAGNHDLGAEFTNRFGDYYYSLKYNNDLFIVLTPGLDSWNISGDQLDFLKSELDSNYQTVNNIFIFLHELIWWSPTNEYQYVKINWDIYYPGYTNFEDEIKPLLLSYPNPITLYAGDLGATTVVSPFMYHHFDNITLIGSGMGNGEKDNIIITEVYGDSVYYDLIALDTANQDELGEIYDYNILNSSSPQFSNNIKVYPNPCTGDYLTIVNNSDDSLKFIIMNNLGLQLFTGEIFRKSLIRQDVTDYTSGMYFIEFVGEKSSHVEKLIIN